MTRFDFSLNNKVTLVTGASRGIGKAIALAFADAGADVVVASRTLPYLEQLAGEIRAKGRRALVVTADTSKSQDIQSMVAKTLQEFGTIDILVNNAAREIMVPLMKLKEEGWDKMMNLGLKGYYLCAQAAGKVMIEQGKGNIINIASMDAFIANPYSGAYCTAKAGLVHMTRTLAMELCRHGIRVNAIAPGFTKSTMTQPLYNNPTWLKDVENTIPMKRVGEADEIAAVAVFLASNASSYITGATIIADGGCTLAGFDQDIFGQMLAPEYQL